MPELRMRFPWTRRFTPMEIKIAAITARLLSSVVRFQRESDFQGSVARILEAFGFARERKIGPRERVDFMDETGIVLELKVKRIGAVALLRQLKRYAGHDEVKALIVVTLFPVSLPTTIGKKPLHVVELWRAGVL